MSSDSTVVLDVVHEKAYLSKDEADSLFNEIMRGVEFYRVSYTSMRFNKDSTTPCYTTCYTDGHLSKLKPHIPLPEFLQPLLKKIQQHHGCEYNVILVRLYFDQNDHISWHTDARRFLGTPTNVASLSLGERRRFELRAPTHLWPNLDSPSKKSESYWKDEEVHTYQLDHGDLFLMKGKTQDYYHHRVPSEKNVCGPRININFRYIPPSNIYKLEGVHSYYKYCVHGDEQFDDVIKQGKSGQLILLERCGGENRKKKTIPEENQLTLFSFITKRNKI